jgi:hypothetical protein
MRGSILFSVLINIGHGWQYQAVEQYMMPLTVQGNDYDSMNDNSYSDYPFANQGKAYFIYSIVYFCFFILSTGIEVKIVRRMQKELREKRERLAKMNAPNSSIKTASDVDATKSKTDQEEIKREEEDNEKERKVIKMVVLNGIFNFILRAPEMVFWIENAYSWPILFESSSTLFPFSFPGILNLIADVGYLAYILTFSLNFFTIYKFNKNFKEAVVLFWTKKTNENSKK